jgi:hypothetical protein
MYKARFEALQRACLTIFCGSQIKTCESALKTFAERAVRGGQMHSGKLDLKQARVRDAHAHKALVFGACLALVLAWQAPALASHPPRMPRVERVLVHPEDPQRLVIATRFGGYYVTQDGGATFLHVCQQAMGYDDTEAYPGHYSRSGAVVVSTGYRGIASSSDACGWSTWAPSGPVFIADVAAASDDLLLALNSAPGGEGFQNQIWSSADAGTSWQPLGEALPADRMVFGVAASPDAAELFVTARHESGIQLLTSSDSGVTWQQKLVASDVTASPRLIGQVPGSPGHLVVLLAHEQVDSASPPDTLLISTDAGESFQTLYQAQGGLPGATFTEDGLLWFGGPKDGLWNVQLGVAEAFPVQVSATPTLGLTWSQGKLYSVGDETTQGYSLAVSEDGGQVFRPLFSFCDRHEQLSCAAGSSVAAMCSQGIEVENWEPLGEVCGQNPGGPGEQPHDHPHEERDEREVRGIVCHAAPGPVRGPSALWLVLAALGLARRARARGV